MPFYIYKAKINPQKDITGTIEANSEQEVIAYLKKKSYYPISIKKKEIEQHSIFSFSQRIKRKEITAFTRQLADLLQADLPLVKALSSLARQSFPQKLKIIIEELESNVERGEALSEGLRRYPVFSSVDVSMVKAGEASGTLDKTLFYLAKIREQEEEIGDKVISAFAYPLLVIVVTGISLFVLFVFVIPKFTVMFADLNQVLPLPTQLLISFSNFMHRFWGLAIVSILFAGGGLWTYSKRKKGQLWIDRVKLKFPFLGKIIQKREITKFCRTAGTLLQSGIPLLNVLGIVSPVMNNSLIAKEINSMERKINAGEDLSLLLRRSKFFSLEVSTMTAVGEKSGKLGVMLLRAADIFEKQTNQQIKVMLSLLEPLSILVLGLIVGAIVISLLLPIFQINIAGY